MKKLLLTILCVTLAGVIYAAPPDPLDEEAVISREAILELEAFESREVIEAMELLEDELIDRNYSIKNLELKIQKLDKRYKGIGIVLEGLDDGFEIDELILDGDSIFLRLDNDSEFIFRYAEIPDEDYSSRNDIIRFGTTIIIEEDEIIEGDVISVFGDVIVNGTVEGEVNTFSGDIYIASTGYVANGVVAISGKIKREPGSRVGSVTFSTHRSSTDFGDDDRAVYRMMAFVLSIIFVIWFILTATCASLMRTNVKKIEQHIKSDGLIKSFFWGYLIYFLGFLAFIGLLITIIGIPVALLGLPLAFLAATVLSSTVISNLIGQKILPSDNQTFKTFLYGSLYLYLLPGLLFLVQLITGNLVIMIFSWIVISIFIFIIFPIGLGAVYKTRFGYRAEDKSLTTLKTEESS